MIGGCSWIWRPKSPAHLGNRPKWVAGTQWSRAHLANSDLSVNKFWTLTFSDNKQKNCKPLKKFKISEILPIIKNCNLSICNDSSFSHLSAALGIKTITLMVDTPIIYGNYNSRMFPIIPEGVETVNHHTDGKEKINPEKVYKKVIEILN